MIEVLRAMLVLFLLVVLSAAQAQPAPVDQRDPAAVARAYLEACDRWDADTAAGLTQDGEADALRALQESPQAAVVEQLFGESLCSPLVKHATHVMGELSVTAAECRVRVIGSYTIPATLVLRKSAQGLWQVALEESMLSTTGGAEAMLVRNGVPAPLTDGAAGRPSQEVCLSNLKQLALAALCFAQDHDEVLPAAENWTTDLLPYTRNAATFCCPLAPYGYTYNLKVAKKPLAQIDDFAGTVMFFEAAHPQASAAGDPQQVAGAHRHDGGDCFAYVDGHCKWEKAK